MKKRMLSILLCFCMALSLLPMSALAAAYNSWAEATANGVALNEGDNVTIDGVTYIYKGDAGTTGIQMFSSGTEGQVTALKEACIWKAGNGYVLYKPTVENGKTTSTEVTLHDAQISVSGATALSLPFNSDGNQNTTPVDVTVKVEGTNSISSPNADYTLYHLTGDTTFTGGGELSITGNLSNHYCNDDPADVDAVTIKDGTKVTITNSTDSTIAGNLTVTGSGAKLTIAEGTTLNIGAVDLTSQQPTVTVKDNAVLENNGTLKMYKSLDSRIIGNISGNGVIKLNDKPYALVDGKFYAHGGDVGTSGLDLSTNAPTITTRYKAGNGYALFTPAGGGANAKLELHGAVISTTSGRALFLPAEPVDITVTGDNNLTANGSYNYAIDTNEQAVSITGGGNLSLTGSNGIVPCSGNTPSITINIGGALNIATTSNPIQNVSGNLQITAKSITIGDAYGVFCNGIASFEATDGDITLTGGSGMAAVNGNAGVHLKASGKITVDNSAGSSALSSEYGTVTVDSQGDVAIEANGVAIWFGTDVAIRSYAGNVDVTTGGYTCIEKSSGGAGGGGVALRAATDITLNADTTAISTSAEDVCLTAGGTLSSTSKYGFQVRELTIEANEVSLEGTQQDGILATSVAITNPTGGNCKSVSVTGSGGDSYAAIRALGDATTGNITVKADDLFLCGNDNAKAISALGTVTIEGAGLIVGTISVGIDKISAGIARASKSGGKLSDKLDLKVNTPAETTYYELNSGSHDCYIIFTPKSGNENAVLTLHDIYNAGYLMGGIILPDEPITLKLEGINVFFEIKASNNITVSGNGSLNSEIINSKAGAVLTVENGATLNAMYSATADNITIYGTYYFSSTVSPTTKLKLNTGAVLKLEYSRYLEFEEGAPLGNLTIGTGASIVNNTYVTLPKDTTVEQIKALPLSGTGVVRVAKTYNTNGAPETWDYYTNDGVALKEITGGLDLTAGVDHSGKTVANDGYSWDSARNTLTLGNHAYVSGNLTLPCNTAVTIHTTGSSIFSGTISAANAPGGYPTPINLTFTGTAPLTINGGISGGTNNDTVTIQSGAQVTTGRIFLGASGGADGTLNVKGAGTSLTASDPQSSAVYCQTINVQEGASLTANGNSVGVMAMNGNVNVTGGSTLRTNCEYGVYILGGKLVVDSSSKLMTNGSVAPFCIVDTTSNKSQSDVLSLSGKPAGTEIKSATGTKGKYWSLVPTGGSLSVSNENNEPVTLTGAVKGALTFVKESSGGNNNNNGGGSNSGGGGSGGSLSYTLTFETNGGSKISSISKENGTTLDLASYKPSRDGYEFAGWYADTALTEKLSSVKLTKSTTVYAKWTEQSAKPVNPFADVAENAYYYDAVLWAVQKNVTSGTTNTAFSPEMICTRAQAVTFLWRAMGSPEPTSTNCPFTDVSKDAYYDKAVLWAIEKGIVKGTSPTTFSPNDNVTRSQSMTFLWRAAGETTSTSSNPFADVSKDAYYYTAVLWAVEKGITKGTSETVFSPDGGCTRSQLVTFLYRYAGK